MINNKKADVTFSAPSLYRIKNTARRMIAGILLLCIVLCTSCGKAATDNAAGGGSIEGDLTDILAEIYAGANLDTESKEALQGYLCDTLTAENEQAILGAENVPYIEGIYSIPMMSSIAYQCVLLRVATEDVETVTELLKTNADVDKWVCVSAETVLVENIGDLVLFIMCDKEAAYALSASFQALGQ